MADRGRQALMLVDGRRESPLESRSFVVLHGAEIPLPLAQVDVFDEAGRLVGRVDGWWPKYATVCEADGRAKYSLADWADLGASTADDLFDARVEGMRRALVREKVREDRLRALGLEVVRFGTVDITARLPNLIRDIRRAWARGDPSRVTGRLVQIPWPATDAPSFGGRRLAMNAETPEITSF